MDALLQAIRDEIRRTGPFPFARYMETALYAPGLGYYERTLEIGKGGDFYTSVSTGSLFGEMLAYQFTQWAGPEASLELVEAGAHDGRLATDILEGLRSRLDVKYWIVEPSTQRHAWQKERLDIFKGRIEWVSDLAALPAKKGYRIIFSNELLDAMPVHRYQWNAPAHRWEEFFVDWDGAALAWLLKPSSFRPVLDAGLLEVLPDEFIVEHSPAAIQWWQEAQSALPDKLIAFDYGLTDAERFIPSRANGSLRTYSKHHAGNDLLAAPGQCDITAHVNFSELSKDALLLTQEQFFTRILAQTEAAPGSFPPWTPQRIRQFQTLTHPDHLGRAFRVLVQSPLVAE